MQNMRLVLGPLALVSAAALAACSGGPASTIPSQPASSGPAAQAAVRAETLQPLQTLRSPSAADLVYVDNEGNNTITVYRQDQSGDTPPLRTIAGWRTGINHPGQLAQDAAGNLYVANAGFSKTPNVSVFAHGASGNVAPIRKIDLPAKLVNIEALTVDARTGNLFVFADKGNVLAANAIELLRYAPNAEGNAAPSAAAPILFPAVQVASDSTGAHLIEGHSANDPSDVAFGVETLPKQFTSGTGVPPIYDTAYFQVSGLADDPATKTYLATSGAIYRLAEDTVGSGPNSPFPNFSPKTVAVITSASNCGQLAVGYERNIFAVCGNGINVYAPDATGNAGPLRVLAGSATKLDGPFSIYEGQ